MCRFIAYLGKPIFLDELIAKPRHSLLRQSLRAEEAKTVTNGDGFGIGWYGERPEPAVYREVMPAWSDDNLMSLAGFNWNHTGVSGASPNLRADGTGDRTLTITGPAVNCQRLHATSNPATTPAAANPWRKPNLTPATCVSLSVVLAMSLLYSNHEISPKVVEN